MDWYYAINNERIGPVSEGEFLRLIASGEVGRDTMVWREGMTAWQPCHEVQPAARLGGEVLRVEPPAN